MMTRSLLRQVNACGHPWVSTPESSHGNFRGIGYLCDACGLDWARIDLERAHTSREPYPAYLSMDGRAITLWPGDALMEVTSLHATRTGFHGSKIFHVRATDDAGRSWYGKGAGTGMFITMRPAKS